VHRSLLIRAALVLALPGAPRAQEAAVAPSGRDPDRGLEPAFRAVLARRAPEHGSEPSERWAARLDACFARLAELWSAGRLDALAREPWVAAELKSAPLGSECSEPAEVSGAWSFARGPRTDSAPEELPWPRALATWRAEFTSTARLEHELLELAGDLPALTARVRWLANGAAAAGRAQHDATWSCDFRAEDGDGERFVLTAVRLEAFESAVLAAPRALFTDTTESALGSELYRREVAPGLDHWRRTLPDALEPGSLGHHGLALGDADGDGREDVYWCRPGGLPNRLFLHAADDGMRDVSTAAGVDLLDYSSGALFLELDGDGDLDLVVTTASGLAFFENDGAARFERRALLERSLATSLAAADVDADGDLDLYVCSYVSPYERSGTPVPYHDANNGEANQLLRHDGAWRFEDATVALGLDENNRRFSLGAAFEDLDADGDPDLYVANDFGRNNLYRNEGGRFRDVAAELGALDVSAGMGVTFGDADGDGWLDVYVSNMHSPTGMRLTSRAFRPGSSPEVRAMFRDHARGNTLLLSERGRAFRDASEASGVHLGRWAWGGLFLDLDGDGDEDLFVPNGLFSGERREDVDDFFWREVVLRSPDGAGPPEGEYALGWRAARRLVRQGFSWSGYDRNVAFLSRGGGRFADASGPSGLDFAEDARAAARIDWDSDGDEDLLVTNRTGPMLRLLRNESAPRAWVAFELVARARPAIGARVELVTSSGRRLVRALRCGEGFLAQSSARLHFGLGDEDVARVTVRWPDGARESFEGAHSGAVHRLVQGSGSAERLPARTVPSRLAPSPAVDVAPPGVARTVLPVPLPLPRLALVSADGRPAALFGITLRGPSGTGHPLLLVPWSRFDEESRATLARLGAAGELAGGGLQVLALCIDAPDERAAAQAELVALAWPFGAGGASEEALQVLELVYAAVHDDARALVLPTAFLVDAGGRLLATYQGRIEPEVVRADLALAALSPAERRDACVPFPGRWLAPPPGPFDERVAARLDEHGLTRAAGEYRIPRVEVRSAADAQREYEQGVVHQRASRYAEAVASYERALAADAKHLRAAQNLGVALHQLGRRAEALAAYERALALDPAHARTRSNLGHLFVELGRLDEARAELATLRALESELAPALEQRLSALEPR
jgi:tetratricopeptide (TPR) repeat protein